MSFGHLQVHSPQQTAAGVAVCWPAYLKQVRWIMKTRCSEGGQHHFTCHSMFNALDMAEGWP